MLNHSVLADHISNQDEQAFRWLKNVHVHEFEEIKSGYKISFVRRRRRRRSQRKDFLFIF